MSAWREGLVVPLRRDGVAVETIEGEVLLYDARQARAVYLNPTGAVIWGLCDGIRSVADICNALREVYPDAASLPAHVAEALSSLKESGFVHFD